MKPELFPLALLLVGSTLATAQTAEAGSRPATAQSADAAQKADAHILEDGTPVTLRLTRDLSSADATVGQEISFAVDDDVEVDGVTVLRRGEVAAGKVTEAVHNKRMGRAGKLSFSIDYVHLTDGEKAALRSVNDAQGESHVAGMVGMMVSMPVVAAPFFLLMHGENTSFPKGTAITAFIDGDMHLDLTKFGTVPESGGQPPAALTSVAIDSSPPGAGVEIDGKSVGNTPTTIAMTQGSHSVVIRKPGFIAWSETEVVSGATFHISAALAEAGLP
jgi:hypothetical protein